MTRRDYVLLSGAIKAAFAACPQRTDARRVQEGVALAGLKVAEALKYSNPSFDVMQFFKDAGVPF